MQRLSGIFNKFQELRLPHLHASASNFEQYTAVMIVPTGVGATIGGFAGDAMPSARLLASVADTLITHPNVMNGAMMYWPQKNILYVEGHSMNEFAAGRIALQPLSIRSQTIGVIFDQGMEAELRVRHLQAIDAARATLGININCAVTTKVPLQIDNQVSMESGASWGSVEATAALIEAAKALVAKGSTAIAVIGRFPEDDEIDAKAADGEATGLGQSAADMFAAYRAGTGVDGIAGAEAIISHIISKRLQIPCAHAPAFLPAELDPTVSPKACAEEIGYTFLPCVLANLHRAPNLIPIVVSENGVESRSSGGGPLIYSQDVDAVIVPYNSLGGPAVLSFLSQPSFTAGKSRKEAIIICVEENKTAMQLTRASFPPHLQRRILLARSYAEAAGLMAAHKAGILFESITSIVSPVEIIEL